ncbi:hypothetical protein J4H25_25350 [Vibrio alginolyticus]|uniref:hypothetical protein n=1 Tax=Vibrio TaxID=662 RepID=UPI001BD52CE0|nr:MULTISPECIES: hypothetical protein [Vibrio]MBS9880928.1 hypothetical protein [Vibrio alginolyticus]MDW2458110.1 hypothetical protein [Vibrio sp. 1249-1]
MKKLFIFLISTSFCLFFISIYNVSSASTTGVCTEILKGGVFDKHDTLTSEDKFNQVINLISSNEYSSWDKAQNSKLELGIDLIDVIDASLGGSTNQQNFEERRKEFKNLSYSQVSLKYLLISRVEVASRNITNAFVRCVDITTQKGGFAAWIEPSSNRRSFVVNAKNVVLGGGNNFTINKLMILPSEGVSCSIDSFPYEVQGDISIACQKPVSDTVQVSMDTNVGDLSGVDVRGYNDAFYQLQSTVNRLANNGSLVASNTVAFFKSERCPDGWDTYSDADGRYIVATNKSGKLGGTVGLALSNLENRPTGNHQHELKAKTRVRANYTPGGGGDIDWYDHTYKTSNPIAQKGMSFKDGTNAPYIQLLACIKK